MFRSAVYLPSILCLTGLLSAQNILNNSGFESGLMCYQTNVWSGSGVFGEGDYRLSLKLRCSFRELFPQGSAVTERTSSRQPAISSQIPTSPNQQYILSLYVKCPAGTTRQFSFPVRQPATFPPFMNCSRNWNLNTVNFTAAARHGLLLLSFQLLRTVGAILTTSY